jgi:large subunit ribosomal protein L6
VGFANEITIPIPQGVTVELPNPTRIVVTGPDKQKVGQFAAVVRSARPPEPYKGKGVRYVDEYVARKEAKKK